MAGDQENQQQPRDFQLSCPITPLTSDRVLLGHGGGGRLQKRLLKDVFRKHFQSDELAREHDGAYLNPASSPRPVGLHHR